MSTQQPEVLRLTEIARYGFRSEGMSDPPEQFESPTGDMVDYFDHVEIEKELLARITALESQLAQRFDAADMATSAADGFRARDAEVAKLKGQRMVLCSLLGECLPVIDALMQMPGDDDSDAHLNGLAGRINDARTAVQEEELPGATP